jgi:uncharacterized protein involved in type VI secretion and phage assembly
MSITDALLGDEASPTRAGRIAGVVVGLVTNNQDPEELGRVKVRFPWLSDSDEGHWARIAVPMAGNLRGFYFLPEVDDEVLVAFEQGDARFPYVVGALWNGKDAPPEKNDDGQNNVRAIKSRSGHVIRLTDKDGDEKIEIIDKTGSNRIVFDTKNNAITIAADKDITLAAENGSIKLKAQKIEIASTAETKISAGAGMNVEASANMTIKGATVNIN